MAESNQKWRDLKTVVSGIMALTALVTAVTSLLKACDTRLEQASYEALAKSIQDLQKDQASLRVELMALQSKGVTVSWDTDTDGISDVDDTASLKCDEPVTCDAAPPVASASASVSPSPLASVLLSSHTHKASKTKKPAAKPAPTLSASAAMTAFVPPPPWSDVQLKADQL